MDPIILFVHCPHCDAENRIVIVPKPNQNVLCVSCNKNLLKYSPVLGFIYILSNPKIPGLVKIGFTKRSVKQRVKELSSTTGVPTPFSVDAIFLSEAPLYHEKKIHHRLRKARVNSKEFFEIDVLTAIKMAASVTGRNPYNIRDDLFEDYYGEVVDNLSNKVTNYHRKAIRVMEDALRELYMENPEVINDSAIRELISKVDNWRTDMDKEEE